MIMVFNATFINISAILWRAAFLLGEKQSDFQFTLA
jgi:hypothetical protein